MPGFVRTKEDEEKWSRAKEAAGKQTDKGSDGYWALSNYIFHRMGKTEQDKNLANFYKTELYKSIKAPLKTGQLSVKIPKQKSMPGAFDKPSKFFKSEEANVEIKHPSLQKLRDFLMSKKAKR